MYNEVTNAFKGKILEKSRTFRARLINAANSKEVISDGFFAVKVYEQSNEDTETLSLGGTVSSYIEVELYKPAYYVTGKEYKLQIGLQLDDGTLEYVQMGLFTAQKPSEDNGKVTFTAYDRFVSRLAGLYSSALTYPVDGKTVLREVQKKSGITIEGIDSLPDGVMIPMRTTITDDEKTLTERPFDGYSYRETIGYLALMYGKFATMNRNGNVELRWYKDTGYRVETNMSYDDIVCAETNFAVQYIHCTIGDDSEKTVTSGSGSTGINANAPVMTKTILDAVYKQVGGMTYLPTTCSFKGDPRIELGDILTVVKRDGTEVKVPVMSLTFEYDGGLVNSVGSYGDTEQSGSSSDTGPSTKRMNRVYSDLLLVKEVVATKASIAYLQANYASISELDAANARIDAITSTDITTSYLNANYADITMSNVDTLNVRQGFMKNLMIDQGLIADRIVGTEIAATDVLTGVNIYADDITAGTLSVDRLVMRGSDKSVVYELNNISGALQAVSVDTLNGEIITPRSITADRIVAKSITSDEINVTDLKASGFVKSNRLTAKNIEVDDLRALSATIGGFTIGATYLANATTSLAGSSGGVYVGLDGISCGTAFKVTKSGELTASSGIIGGFTIGSTYLANGTTSLAGAVNSVYVGIDGISCGTAFKVTKVGNAVIEGNISCYDKLYMKNKSITYNGKCPSYAVIDSSSDGVHICGVYEATGGKKYITLASATYLNGKLGNRVIISADTEIQGGTYCKYGLTCADISTTTTRASKYLSANGSITYIDESGNVKGSDITASGRVYTASKMGFTAAYSAGAEIYCTWRDGANHAALLRDTDGLTMRLGWYGSSSYKTVLQLRGQTVQYRNASGTTALSDERLKNSFRSLQEFDDVFMNLDPVAFRYNNGASGRFHFGFKAQNVRDALIKSGFTLQDFGGIVQMEDDPTSEDYCGVTDPLGLIYTEFTSWNTHMIQKTIKKVDNQDVLIRELQQQIYNLEFELQITKLELEELRAVA